MKNYDTMSASELLSEYIWQAGHVIGASEIMPAIWSALKRAVIREASVGVTHVRGYGDDLYDLIPHKDTP